MSDLTKIDIMFSDLEALERSLKSLLGDHSRVTEERHALESRMSKILDENKNLRKRVAELEAENETLKSGSFGGSISLFEQMSDHEKAIMAQKINDLILKINRHLINL